MSRDPHLFAKINKADYSADMVSVPRTKGNNTVAKLALVEEPAGPAYAGKWIGQLVALGAKAWRHLERTSGQQLVVAITVPRREFAAVLVGCGWTMAHPAPQLGLPIDVLRQLTPGTPVRLVTDRYVVTSKFLSLEEGRQPARVRLHGSGWLVNKIDALCVMAAPAESERAQRPSLGSVGRFARLDDSWAARLACPATDLAIVGTLAWLREDIQAYLSLEGAGTDGPDQLSTLLLTQGSQAATWSTRLYSSAGFADQLPLPPDIRAAVLDGAAAIKYLAEIEAPVVICIVDRSIADETAAEIIVQSRNMGSTPVPVADLEWYSVPGIEALAFAVPL